MIVQEIRRDALRAETLAAALASVLVGGVGIQVDLTGSTVTITSTVEGVGDLADFLMLSGDQQGGGSGDTSGASLDERIRDTMALALQAGAGITITPNDVGNSITIAVGAGVGGDNLTAEAVQDIVGALLAAGTGISVTYNDAGNVETITATGLDATYKGIVPTGHNANFDFADAMNGRSTNWTGGAGVATIRLEADVALSAGWVHRIRNTGTGNLSIQRVTAGVSLFKNGAVVSADAILAPGGTVTLERWGANDFTITGTKLS
jgi:hypothetical protein